MDKCKNCDHSCHCAEDQKDTEHYTPLMELCSCSKCEHETEEDKYEECLSCQ